MRKVFKDPDQQAAFEKDGYVVAPLLSEEQISELMGFYAECRSEVNLEFYTTVWSSNYEYRSKVRDVLFGSIGEAAGRLLLDYKPIFANYMVKSHGEKSSLDYHQDWTFTDERKFYAVNVWVPLVDTNEENGMLHIVNRSHLLDIPYRGRNIDGPFWYLNRKIHRHFSEGLEVRAGHAVIFNEKLIHGSENNRSGKTRVAASVVMTPKEAELYHFMRKKGSDQITQYQVTEDFFIDHELENDLDTLEPIKVFDYPHEDMPFFEFCKGLLVKKEK